MTIINGYKFNTIAETNNAIQSVNTQNEFTPIYGNVTQSLVNSIPCTYDGASFYVIEYNNYSQVLGEPTEINID
jgi:hypothetical protein